MKRFYSLLLTLAVVFSMIGFIPANAATDPSAVGKPKISVKVSENTAKLTIKKTANAEGYYVYLKSASDKDFSQVAEIAKNGASKRKYTLSGLAAGDYKVKVRAYAGENLSKYSKTKSFTIEGAKSSEPKDIVILFTSDVHCGVDQGFTYVGLKAVKDKLIADGNAVILVDDGDSIQGEPIGTLTAGEANIKLMNAVGYEIAIPGNHEFDYGMDRFLELTKLADFKYISSNFNFKGELVFDPYVIKELGGKKVAFVGITTPKTITSSTPHYFQDENGNYVYGFLQDETGEAVYNAVQKAVDDARSEGADYVVAMAHLGNETECEPWTYVDVITHTNGIDVFLDGHSHDTDSAKVINKDGKEIIRQACGTKLANIGWVRINSKDGNISTGLYTWTNSESLPEVIGTQNAMTAELSKALDSLNERLATVVAKTGVDLIIYDPVAKDDAGNPIRIVRSAETNLGDLCADAYRDQAGSDVAIVNGGGIRVSISKGDITYKDILNVHPFGNMLTVREVTGQQILDALEWGCRATPSSNGGFPQVSGISFEIHTYIESTCTSDENGMFTGVSGEYRVKNVKVGSEPLDLNKKYTLASHNYLLINHGDGYAMFDGTPILQDSVKLDNQVLMDYIINTLGGVVGDEYSNPYGEGRIVAVEKAE
ncbi:MAG: 5'-nucleotidase C-terminal domain-containing protein [Lachnospiraceae bacterium]|nr:5'-nucleotidase C-terminal domain-containing protein [Lachnospiraceae bacterium]